VRSRQTLEQRNQAGQCARVRDALLVRLLDGEQADGEASFLLKVVAAAGAGGRKWASGGARARV
jgi:hypothetical protein